MGTQVVARGPTTMAPTITTARTFHQPTATTVTQVATSVDSKVATTVSREMCLSEDTEPGVTLALVRTADPVSRFGLDASDLAWLILECPKTMPSYR